jgi:acetyl-CoA carboxylase carboxyltransferase component
MLAERCRVRDSMAGKCGRRDHARRVPDARALIDEFADTGSFLEVGTFVASADRSERRTTPAGDIIGGHPNATVAQ